MKTLPGLYLLTLLSAVGCAAETANSPPVCATDSEYAIQVIRGDTKCAEYKTPVSVNMRDGIVTFEGGSITTNRCDIINGTGPDNQCLYNVFCEYPNGNRLTLRMMLDKKVHSIEFENTSTACKEVDFATFTAAP